MLSFDIYGWLDTLIELEVEVKVGESVMFGEV